VGLATRARILCRLGRLAEAERVLVDAHTIRSEAGRLVPFHESFVVAAGFELAVRQLETACIAGDRARARAAARRARKIRRRALSLARKVAPRRVEVLRLAAEHDWWQGRRSRALRGFSDCLAAGRALGARPELARSFLSIARCLESDGKTVEFEGRDAASCREEARRLRVEMGLSPEPAPG
jgi:hypothetical protein